MTELKTIAFDAFVLAAVASGLRRLLIESRVQKVQQPSDFEVILLFYGKTGTHRLLLSADPQFFRAHLTQVKRDNPVAPPAFCQVARKYLEGALLDSVTMPRFDRVLHLEFRAHDGERILLIAELMGRNSNVILVNGTGVVRGVLRPIPRASERALRPGHPYEPPPGYTDRADPLTSPSPLLPEAREEAGKMLTETFLGIGKFAADEIVARGEGGFVALMSAVRNEAFAPHSIGTPDGETVGVWAFPPLTVPPGLRFPRDDISIALDTFYTTRSAATQEESERSLVARLLARERAFREKDLASARATLAEAGRADEYERAGNNLLAQLNLVKRGDKSVTISDLYAADAGEVTLTLDPKLSPHENAEAFFSRARKARDAAEHAAERAVQREEELSRLRLLELDLERGADPAQLKSSLGELAGEQRVAPIPAVVRAKEDRPFKGHRIRQVSVQGYELLYGETGEANDYLTTRVASPTDLWMHVRSAPGAHGVLRTSGKPDRVPDTVIRHAAAIIAARSGSAIKHAEMVAVDVVEKKYVRKPRGAKPGLVTIERERVIDVTPSLE